MSKQRVLVIDNDINYIIPIQTKFAEEFFENIDLEIITEQQYFDSLFSSPQKIDILIISAELYNDQIQRHDIGVTFVMSEENISDDTGFLNVNYIYKYTSIREIFNQILGKSGNNLKLNKSNEEGTKVIAVYSAEGGAGRTTVSMGIASSLVKNFKNVLYINADRLQNFQYLLKDRTPIGGSDLYQNIIAPTDKLFHGIKHLIRKEEFNYLPPFSSSIMSLGIDYSVFEKLMMSAKMSEEYDYIIVDCDSVFDEYKAEIINKSDKVIVLVKQTKASVFANNILVGNINGIDPEKFLFICNDFKSDKENHLISNEIKINFRVSDYISHIDNIENKNILEIAQDSSIQRATFLIM